MLSSLCQAMKQCLEGKGQSHYQHAAEKVKGVLLRLTGSDMRCRPQPIEVKNKLPFIIMGFKLLTSPSAVPSHPSMFQQRCFRTLICGLFGRGGIPIYVEYNSTSSSKSRLVADVEGETIFIFQTKSLVALLTTNIFVMQCKRLRYNCWKNRVNSPNHHSPPPTPV